MEISDYQVAAALLGLPSMISSDRFVYGNPGAVASVKANFDQKGPKRKRLHELLDHLMNNKEAMEVASINLDR